MTVGNFGRLCSVLRRGPTPLVRFFVGQCFGAPEFEKFEEWIEFTLLEP